MSGARRDTEIQEKLKFKFFNMFANGLIDVAQTVTLGSLDSFFLEVGAKYHTLVRAGLLDRDESAESKPFVNTEYCKSVSDKLIPALEQLIEANKVLPNIRVELSNALTEVHDNIFTDIKQDLKKLTEFLKDPDNIKGYEPEALGHIAQEFDKCTKEKITENFEAQKAKITELVKDETIRQQRLKELDEQNTKALEAYEQATKDFFANLNAQIEAARIDREIMLGLCDVYPEYKSRPISSLKAYLDKGQNLAQRSISGQKMVLSEDDKLTITLPPRFSILPHDWFSIYSNSLYHLDPDDRFVADFTFLAKARKVLNKDKPPEARNKITITIGGSNEKENLSGYDLKLGRAALQGALLAGYKLEDITINLRGNVLKAGSIDEKSKMKSLVDTLKLSSEAISKMTLPLQPKEQSKKDHIKLAIKQLKDAAEITTPISESPQQQP